jgi:hypothetical protein
MTTRYRGKAAGPVGPVGPQYTVPLTTQTSASTSYALAADDSGKVKEFTASSAITVTLPNSLAAGFNCIICQAGTGQITLSPASGATLRNAGDGEGNQYTKTFAQWSEISIRVRANSNNTSAEYVASGDMI